MESRLAFTFDADHGDLTAEERTALLGGKGAGLARMTAMGLPVPPGFTLTTDACRRYLRDGWNDEMDRAVCQGLAALEAASGKALGDRTTPLLVSVRSGAAVSMPGMMDTVLDVGMTLDVQAALATRSGDAVFAADTARRALLSHADVVAGATDDVLDRARRADGVEGTRQVLAAAGIELPVEPVDQVRVAVKAVFESWRSERAGRFRAVEGIDDDGGTAATVQAMVFGNLGDRSGTGVAFTRDPSTGAPGVMGDVLLRAQGEDVVAGTHATRPLADLADLWPTVWADLVAMAARLEHDLADMVDIEFTVEEGRLFLLQARLGKRSPVAVFRTAVDMAEDPAFPLARDAAVARCRHLLDDPPVVSTNAATDDADDAEIVRGLAAAPGRAVGMLCTDVDDAVARGHAGNDVVLVRHETSPADVHGIAAARGLVTKLGGLVSHAAVVARSWGLPAVVGASDLILHDDGSVEGPRGRVAPHAIVTVDGDGGRLLAGSHPGANTVPPVVRTVQRWAAELDGSTAGAGEPTALPPLDPDVHHFALLHVLRIKGFAATNALVASTGCDEAVVEASLRRRVADGCVIHHETRNFWQVTPAGREQHLVELHDVVASLELDDLRYESFLVTNDDFKALCTDWQLRDGEPNDHTDAAHDRAVLDRLRALHAAATPVLVAVGATLPWAGRYLPRLGEALARALSGDPKAVTGVLCESYHDIWMELHEDLLLTQDLDRAAEGST